MLDQLLVPFFEIFSLLTFDFFDVAFILELASGAWEWTLFAIQSLQRLILVLIEYLGHVFFAFYPDMFPQYWINFVVPFHLPGTGRCVYVKLSTKYPPLYSNMPPLT